MAETPSLLYFELVKRNKGFALVAKMCRAVNCENPLSYVTVAGLLLSSKRHRKDEEHSALLTPEDLEELAKYIRCLQSESVKIGSVDERAA